MPDSNKAAHQKEEPAIEDPADRAARAVEHIRGDKCKRLMPRAAFQKIDKRHIA